MSGRIILLVTFFLIGQLHFSQETDEMQKFSGYFDFYWSEKDGKIWLEIDKLDQEFLYVNSLSHGLGSNDIGLDRGQLGAQRVVKFEKIGDKILMVQPNLRYRAITDSEPERRSVKEAFGRSVLWGFKIKKEKAGSYLVDMTNFLMQDAHGVSKTLQRNSEGTYRVDVSRSAINLKRTRAFPKNSEFDVILTFKGEPQGRNVRSVTPTASAITLNQHHSFIELPDDDYKPRKFDPRSGYWSTGYFDYAAPIDQDMEMRFISRHRLRKKDPSAVRSEAIESIIYYLDPGVPEPVRSALLDGARWWNQAFEAAGYINAFQVKMLPAGADPMDVRYNVIQWVHRSTRGWSYGGGVTDPRTGEIIKGHVSLGSLRVRQDYLIAQGLASLFDNDAADVTELKEMALARIRQLSAHEVGHTLGLAHNFAASTNDRASVMDYPHPVVGWGRRGPDFTDAYDTGIGEWDKRTIMYGYSDFAPDVNEVHALQKIIAENQEMGLRYITDLDSRSQGSAHPYAHLWDNGESAVQELERIMDLRSSAMENFGINSIPRGQPLARLEDVFVPLYLAHRYQVEATAKLIGGVEYAYDVKDGSEKPQKQVEVDVQESALRALLKTLQPSFLTIPKEIQELLLPRPPGFADGREHFKGYTGLTFDPYGAAEASAAHTLQLLLNPQRLARVLEQGIDTDDLGLTDFLDEIGEGIGSTTGDSKAAEINRLVEKLYVLQLLAVMADGSTNKQVQGAVWKQLQNMESTWNNNDAHDAYLRFTLNQFVKDPLAFKLPTIQKMPDGSPIGCGY